MNIKSKLTFKKKIANLRGVKRQKQNQNST